MRLIPEYTELTSKNPHLPKALKEKILTEMMYTQS